MIQHYKFTFYLMLSFFSFGAIYKDKAPEFFINLDEPVETRYNIFKIFTPDVQEYVRQWIEFVNFTDEELAIFDNLKVTHPDRELIEITQSLANVFQIPFNKMLAFQYEYDFGAIASHSDMTVGCTSIVVQPQNGEPPYIARNLDYNFQQLVARATVMIHYYQGSVENVIYTNLNVAGQLTFGQTLKSSHASMTMDRLTSTITKQALLQLISEAKSDTLPRYLMKSLTSSNSYGELKQKLLNGVVLVHGVVALVGTQTNEACLIHLYDSYSKDNENYLSYKIQEVNSQQNWFLVTNGNDTSFSVERQQEGDRKMAQLTQEELSTPQIVIDKVLSQYPNGNVKTIYSVIMISNPYYIEHQFYY